MCAITTTLICQLVLITLVNVFLQSARLLQVTFFIFSIKKIFSVFSCQMSNRNYFDGCINT